MQRLAMTGMLLILFSSVGLASDTPRDVIQSSIDSMTTALSNNKNKVQEDEAFLKDLINQVIFPHVDFNHMNRVALGPYYDEAESSQKVGPFNDALKNNIFNVYDVALKSYDGQDIDITSVKIQKASDVKEGSKRKAIVGSKIDIEAGTPIAVDYIMHQTENGWKVYDIRVDQVGFLKSFSSSIKSSIRRKGLDKTIEILNEM